METNYFAERVERHQLLTLLHRLRPEQVREFISGYIDFCKEKAPRQKVSEHTEMIDLTACFDLLEAAVSKFLGKWQRAFWLAELERYKRTVRLPTSSAPPDPAALGGL